MMEALGIELIAMAETLVIHLVKEHSGLILLQKVFKVTLVILDQLDHKETSVILDHKAILVTPVVKVT